LEEQEQIKRGLVRCNCTFCGKLFWSERGSAQYCTASCKQKMYRWRIKLTKEHTKAKQCIDNIASYLIYDKSTPAAVAVLHELKGTILEALLKAKVIGVK